MSFSDMTNFRYLPLTEILLFIVDNRGKTVPTAEDGLPLIATNCIKNNELYPVFEKIRYISQDTYDNWFRAHPIPGDIIFVNKGTPGRVCLVPNPVGFCIAQDMMAFRVNDKLISNKYLFAVLRSPQFQMQIEQFHVGTLIPHFKKGDLDKLLIPIPSRNVQNYIGETYYALCNKIEINNRINKTLEEMAQAIFKSWFVDFEPFQDGEFEDSELGRIPKGWRVGTLGELISDTLGGDWGKETSQGNFVEEVTCIRGADIPEIASGKKGKPATRFILKKNLEKKQLTEGKIIIEISGGSPTQSTGRTALITKELVDVYDKPLICTNFCRALSLKKDSYSTFVYSMLQYLYKIDLFFLYENGTTGIKNLDTNNLFNKYQIVIPTDEIMMQYEVVFNTLLKFIYKNGSQSDMLSTIRDTLLPKLMSSEIRVPIEEVQ